MQTPLEKYKDDLNSEEFNADPSQKAAVIHLQRLFIDLLTKQKNKNFNLVNKKFLFFCLVSKSMNNLCKCITAAF
jgi:predicted ATPase